MHETAREPGVVDATNAGSHQYLTFTLADTEYGVDILRVQEIRGFGAVTPIPNAPPAVVGVTNLRGTVVPVLDLRVRIGLDARPHDPLTVIVILNVAGRVVGMVVDSVADVVDLDESAVGPPPEVSVTDADAVIAGIARRDDRLILLLDIARVVDLEGSASGSAAGHAA